MGREVRCIPGGVLVPQPDVLGSGIRVEVQVMRNWGGGIQICVCGSGARSQMDREVLHLFFCFTLTSGPSKSLSLTLNDTGVYELQIRAKVRCILGGARSRTLGGWGLKCGILNLGFGVWNFRLEVWVVGFRASLGCGVSSKLRFGIHPEAGPHPHALFSNSTFVKP